MISSAPQTRISSYLDLSLQLAIEILKGDKGNLQFVDEKKGCLILVSAKGFDAQFVEHFKEVKPGYCACGTSMKRRQRVVVENFSKDPAFSHLGPIFASYGFQAVVSTPFFNPAGKIIGVLSIHFAKPHRPSEKELAALDNYVKDRLGTWTSLWEAKAYQTRERGPIL